MISYLRFRRFFVIIATRGQHRFFADEAKSIKDIRETPLTFHGYSIGYRRGWADAKWHPSVRIAAERYGRLKRRFEAIAVRRSVEQLRREFQRLPFEPWAPVRHQLWSLVRLVNRRRKAASLEPLPFAGLKLRRRSLRSFDSRRHPREAVQFGLNGECGPLRFDLMERQGPTGDDESAARGSSPAVLNESGLPRRGKRASLAAISHHAERHEQE